MGSEKPVVLDLVYRGSLTYFVVHDGRTVRYIPNRSGHLPYFFVRAADENRSKLEWLKRTNRIVRYEEVYRYHPILQRRVKLFKVLVESPSDVPRVRKLFDEKDRWEYDVPYLMRLSADLRVPYGVPSDKGDLSFRDRLALPVPDVRRQVLAFDIEVLNKSPVQFPKPYTDTTTVARHMALHTEGRSAEVKAWLDSNRLVADSPVLSVSVAYYTGGKLTVELLMLRRWERTPTLTEYVVNKGEVRGKEEKCEDGTRTVRVEKLGGGYEEVTVRIRCFDSEEKLLSAFWLLADSKRVWVTYNGSNFDLPYLFYRSLRLGLEESVPPLLPVSVSKEKVHVYPDGGVHVDLFYWFSQPSIKTYAHGSAYSEFTLDAVASGILGVKKYQLPPDTLPSSLPFEELVQYSATDAYLTVRLFENDWDLMVMMLRAVGLPLHMLLTSGISRWVFNLILRHSTDHGLLIPRQDELPAKIYTTDLSETGKKYLGAYVHEPPTGVFFDVVNLDVASLYPTMIIQHNLSYETVDNPNLLPRCRQKEYIRHPKSGKVIHTVCLDERGIVPSILKSITETRLEYKRRGNKVVSNTLKVLINAMYGVFGQENFRLFSGVAECVTLKGRETILELIRYSGEEQRVPVLYADTDSLFLWAPPEEAVQRIIEKARELKVELERDKDYRLVVFPGLKKNYLGVTRSGKLVIKGLTGKKSNTPPAIQEMFSEVAAKFAEVKRPEEVLDVVEYTKGMLRRFDQLLRSGADLSKFVIAVGLNKDLDEYDKESAHVKAAKQLRKYGIEYSKGSKVYYLYTVSGPLALAEAYMRQKMGRKVSLDAQKYKELLDSVLSQLLMAVGVASVGKSASASLLRFIGTGSAKTSRKTEERRTLKLRCSELSVVGTDPPAVLCDGELLLLNESLEVSDRRRVGCASVYPVLSDNRVVPVLRTVGSMSASYTVLPNGAAVSAPIVGVPVRLDSSSIALLVDWLGEHALLYLGKGATKHKLPGRPVAVKHDGRSVLVVVTSEHAVVPMPDGPLVADVDAVSACCGKVYAAAGSGMIAYSPGGRYEHVNTMPLSPTGAVSVSLTGGKAKVFVDGKKAASGLPALNASVSAAVTPIGTLLLDRASGRLYRLESGRWRELTEYEVRADGKLWAVRREPEKEWTVFLAR